MVEDDCDKNVFICCKAFQIHGIKVECAELLSSSRDIVQRILTEIRLFQISKSFVCYTDLDRSKSNSQTWQFVHWNKNFGLLHLKMVNINLNMIILQQKSLKIFKQVTLICGTVLWPVVPLTFGKDKDIVWLLRTTEQCSLTLQNDLNS